MKPATTSSSTTSAAAARLCLPLAARQPLLLLPLLAFFILHASFFISRATAQTNKGVTTISVNTTESDVNYVNTDTGAGALLTVNSFITYSGTNINLTSPSSATNGKWLLRLNAASTVTLHGGTLAATHPTNTGASGALIYAYTNNATRTIFEGYDLVFSSSAPNTRGFTTQGGSSAGNINATLERVLITSAGNTSSPVVFEGGGTFAVTSATFSSSGSLSPSIHFKSTSRILANLTLDSSLVTATGVDSAAIAINPDDVTYAGPSATRIALKDSSLASTQAAGIDINANLAVLNRPNLANSTVNASYSYTANIDLDNTTLDGAQGGLRVTSDWFNGTVHKEIPTTINLSLINTSTLAGGISLAGRALLNLNIDTTSRVIGGVTIADNAILNLNPDVLERIDGGLVFTGAGALGIAATGTDVSYLSQSFSFSGESSIRFEGDTIFTGTLNFTDTAGIIIANVSGTDLTFAPGAAINGDFSLRVENLTNDVLGLSRILLIADEAGILLSSSLTLIPNEVADSGRVDFGRYGYAIETTATSADLVLVRRQFLNSTSGTWNINDMTYESSPASTTQAFYISAAGDLAGSTFTGSNINVIAGGTTGSGRMALVLTGGAVVTIHGGTFAQTNPNAADSLTTANYVYAGSRLTLTDAVIYATAPKIRALGIQSSTSSGAYITLERSLVFSTGTAPAFIFGGRGYVTMRSSTLATYGPSSPGAQFRGSKPEFYFSDGEIITQGLNSSGMWMGGSADFAGLTQMKIELINSRVSSASTAGIDVNSFVPFLHDLPDCRNVQPSWFADFDITAENTTVTGPVAALRVTSRPYWNSNIYNYTSGTTFFGEVPTTVRFNMKSTGTLAGDVILTAAPDIDAALAVSLAAVESPRSLTPPVTATLILNLDNSVLDGAYRADARTSSTIALHNSSTVTGAIALSGNANASITLANASVVNGAITLTDSATAAITFDATSRLAGGVNAGGSSSVTLIPSAGSTIIAPVSLTDNASLLIADRITLDGSLSLNGGAITFAKVSGNDLTLGSGFAISGTGKIAVTAIASEAGTLGEILLISDPLGKLPADALTLEGGFVDLGLAGYTLDNRPGGAWLVGGLGSVGAAMYDTAATAAIDWFASLDPVLSHLASLRPFVPDQISGNAGTLWLDARASSLSTNRTGNLSFEQRTNAIIAGGDSHWNLSAGGVLAGFYVDYTSTDRDFANTTDGSTTAAGAGIYASWNHPRGLFINTFARASRSDHEFSSNDSANPIEAKYKTREFGLAAEIGWRFAFPSTGYWVEPSAQAALVRLGGNDYTIHRENDEDIPVNLADSTPRQYRAQVRAGRDVGAWRWHVAIALAQIDADSVLVSVPTMPGLPPASYALDGSRQELGIGIQRALGRSSAIHLEWSYIKSSRYELPWSLNLAYRHAW